MTPQPTIDILLPSLNAGYTEKGSMREIPSRVDSPPFSCGVAQPHGRYHIDVLEPYVQEGHGDS